ncbi:MAG: Lrp/AsnC family transcriptional regulator [Streptosporangiales bacterium]
MDWIDLRLVDALRANGRESYAELGRLVGLSGPGVQDRVRRLEERGVLTGYHAAVSPDAVGLAVSALVSVYLSDSADQEVVAKRLESVPEIEHCWFVAGDESFVGLARCADIDALEKTLGRMRGIKGVSRTRTTVVLSTRWENRSAPLGEPDE